MGEGSDGMAFHRYSLLVDLVEEGFAESDGVACIFLCRRGRGMIRREPKAETIKKVETRRIDQPIGIRMILGAEEDRGCEDSLETLNHSPVMATVRNKAEEIEHLKSSRKVNDAALLVHGKGGYPYRDQSVLAEGQAELRMGRNLQEEFSVPSRMSYQRVAYTTVWAIAASLSEESLTALASGGYSLKQWLLKLSEWLKAAVCRLS